MEAGGGEGATGVDRAGDPLAERPARGEGDQGRPGLGLVAFLQRSLDGPQLIAFHARHYKGEPDKIQCRALTD